VEISSEPYVFTLTFRDGVVCRPANCPNGGPNILFQTPVVLEADIAQCWAGIYDWREFSRRFVKKASLLAILLYLVATVSAQRTHKPETGKPEAERPATDAHSFMELFSKLERDWGLAVQKKDEGYLDGVVATEFVERDAIDPDHIVTRAEWMESNLRDYVLDPFAIRSMTVRAFLGNAVVSFVQKQKDNPSDHSRGSDYFIVDVWVTNQGKWQVASRSISLVTSRYR